MKKAEIRRMVVNAEWFPEAKRTDDVKWVVGDITILTLDCGHVSYGDRYAAGATVICYKCSGK